MKNSLLPCLALAALLGCGKKDAADRPAADSAPGTRMADSVVASVGGFNTPESVLNDAARDQYLVSNINGNPGDKDNNGFIARLKTDGSVDSMHFIQGGKNGVTLNAPKGMAIAGDSLWVADIDALRVFDVTTGKPLRTVDLSGQHAVFLNDVTRGPDGSIYVSDTGIRITATGMEHPGPDRVFRVAPDGKVSVIAEGAALSGPNGVTWDSAGNRLLIAPFAGKDILAWAPGDTATSVVAQGPGGYDGIEMLRGGRFLVSTWDSSGIYLYDGKQMRAIATGVTNPADIGVDLKRRQILIPRFTDNTVEIRLLPR